MEHNSIKIKISNFAFSLKDSWENTKATNYNFSSSHIFMFFFALSLSLPLSLSLSKQESIHQRNFACDCKTIEV